MHFTDFFLILNAEHLLPPFHLQEGKVGLIENKLCNMLYEHRLNEGKTSPVHEEMLCAGDFLTGKAICRVSEATSVFPLPTLRAVSKGSLYCLYFLCGDPWDFCFLPLHAFPGLHLPVASPRPAPS